MWQAEADSVSSLSASPATAVGQILLTLAKFCYNTVSFYIFVRNIITLNIMIPNPNLIVHVKIISVVVIEEDF